MTDITEMAQKRNAAISRLSRAFEPGHNSQTELDALSFAVDVMNELVEALEKAQRANAAQDDHINQQQDRIELLERGNRYAAKRISSWCRLAKQSIAEQEKCVNELDAARQRIVELDRKNSELNSLTQRWAVDRAKNAERITELEFIRTSADKVQREFADELGCAGDNESILQAIEDLKQQAESRTVTVKLLDCDLAAVQHMSGGSKDYCNGFVDGTQNAIRAMRSAGVDVREAE